VPEELCSSIHSAMQLSHHYGNWAGAARDRSGDGEMKLDAATLVAIGFKALERFHPDVTNTS
jgi:hypothetical protein